MLAQETKKNVLLNAAANTHMHVHEIEKTKIKRIHEKVKIASNTFTKCVHSVLNFWTVENVQNVIP